ncbi:fatty-acid amide hydrolase 2-like [Euwallacea similis]|uniref:fatty-acid amide hydrolase 2-like n=1 Tax=Euwallacea similis TaxID=1736056 RepID=UPI00344B3DFE
METKDNEEVENGSNEKIDKKILGFHEDSHPNTHLNQERNYTTKAPRVCERSLELPLHLRIIRATIYYLIKILNIIYIPVFIHRMFESRKRCPPLDDPLLRITATDLASAIRRREISCESVIKAYICRIKEVNRLLNAVIDDRFEEALEDARLVDKKLSDPKFIKDEDKIARKFPLLGVPITIKGSLAVKGLRHTSGTINRKEHHAEIDAEAVAWAREAGAIPLLVSNVPELCMSWETTNKVIGTTKNPHDITRTCGGSSGGEASLLGAGASLLGLGSDLAGSLRLPAHYCGVWSHKPTPGVVSLDGHYPSCLHRDKWEAVFAVGPMTRYGSDLRTLLKIISVPEKREKLNLDRRIDIKSIKVYYSDFEECYWQPNRHCSGAVKKVVGHLSNICGIQPQKTDFYLAAHGPDLAAIALSELEDVEDAFDGNANGAFFELFRYTTLRSKHTFMLIICGVLRKIARGASIKVRNKINKFIAKIRQEILELLGDDGVLIVPTFPIEAPKHGDVLKTAIFAGYLAIFNTLGLPVTNCPVGVTDKGLPVGIQVAAKPFGDNLTLTVAEEIERAFGGWIEPRGRYKK